MMIINTKRILRKNKKTLIKKILKIKVLEVMVFKKKVLVNRIKLRLQKTEILICK